MNIKDKIKYSKAYKITKDKDENDLIFAKEYFEVPEKFLSINPKISIGVSPDKMKFNHDLQLNDEKKISKLNLILSPRNSILKQNSKLLADDRIIKTEETTKRRFSIFSLKEKYFPKKQKLNDFKEMKITDRNELNKKNYNTIEPNKMVNNIHYKYRTFKDLKKIFKESIEREKYYKSKGTNNLIPIKVDSNIKKKYYSQEKKLKFNQTVKSNEEKYFKNLAKKCNKKEKELLINKIEDYRMKRQLKDYIENNKILSEKFGDNYWLFNLRRSDKNDFIRLNYVNVGNSNREIWKAYVDYPDKDIELIKDPYTSTRYKMPILINLSKKNKKVIKKFPNIKDINEIKIEGKNLVKKEFKDILDITESNSNCKFKLYKDPRENNKDYVNNFTCKELYDYNTVRSKGSDNRYKKSRTINKVNKRYSFYSIS